MRFGFASGGSISQKIIRDTLPIAAYDGNRATRIHISILNAAYFTEITGQPAPPSQISAKMYLKCGLPWYTLYDETLPHANNCKDGTPLSTVQSIATLMRQKSAQETAIVQLDCSYCDYQLATWKLLPCAHNLCDDCASGIDPSVCPAPSCDKTVQRRERFAAPMPLPGNEAEDGIEASSLDARIVKLKRCAERGVVGTFRLDSKRVSFPCAPADKTASLPSWFQAMSLIEKFGPAPPYSAI